MGLISLTLLGLAAFTDAADASGFEKDSHLTMLLGNAIVATVSAPAIAGPMTEKEPWLPPSEKRLPERSFQGRASPSSPDP
jgi:hypothetical protein